MTQHTQGPWRLERGEKQINTHALIVHGPDGLGPVAFATPVNGALIAAAPELYAACQAAAQLLSDAIADYSEYGAPPELKAVRRTLLDALEKAQP